MKLTLTYGTETRDIEIDEAKLAAPFIQPRPAAAAGDARETIVQALHNPIGRPRLKDMVTGKTVALIISDEFRAGLHATILEVLLEEIAAGGPQQPVTVLCATGTHDPKIYTPNVAEWTAEAARKAGLEHVFVGHDCDDPALVDVGQTSRGNTVRVEPSWLEAQVRVFGHEAKHHYMAGYSSVAKQLLPGISARETVAFNHHLALDDDSQAGQYPLHPVASRRTNPFSEDALEALRLALGKTLKDGALLDEPAESFLLDMISDKSSVFSVEAGDLDTVTSAMNAAADEQAEFTVPKSRYVVVSPGGPPASTALYGVQNCFDMALLGAIEQGGEALVLGPCNGREGVDPEVRGLAPDAKSKALFWDNLVRLRDRPLEECYKEIDENFKLYLWKTWRVLRLFKRDRVKIWMYGELSADVLAAGGFEHAPDPQAWIDERVARDDGQFVVIDGGNKLLVRGE